MMIFTFWRECQNSPGIEVVKSMIKLVKLCREQAQSVVLYTQGEHAFCVMISTNE